MQPKSFFQMHLKRRDVYNREAGGIEGIVNGMDVNDWSPLADKFLDVR